MTDGDYPNQVFKQLQDVIKKCDDLSQEMKQERRKFKKEKDLLNEKIERLENKVEKLEVENTKLRNDNDRLKKQINNNSNNSSKPPSSDTKKNIPNNREKSNRKSGGQKGHVAHFLAKSDIEQKIANHEVKHEVINVGSISKDFVSKYIIDIEVNVVAKEYRFFKDSKGKYNIPKEFKTDVQYGNELKILVSILNTEGIVAINRLIDFVSSLTHGKIEISNGTVVNFLNNLSKKSKYLIENIKQKVLNFHLMFTDATTARCNNKNISVRNYSTKQYALLVPTMGKGKKYIEETNILNKYTGNLVHDHETVVYNYWDKHAECNVHISRYLKGCYENTNHYWALNMRSLLCSLNEYRKELIAKDVKHLEKEQLDRYCKRYNDILEKELEENKGIKSKFLKQEEKELLNRLQKYKENHLLFLYDFNMPFDNNLSERDLRHVKTKQKISGYFNSMKGIKNYLDIKSIIGTCKKQKLDIYEIILKIYENIPVSL